MKFLKWVYPLKKESFKGKTVLEAGCGNGRCSFYALKYGAEKLMAFDNHPTTVAIAKRNLEKFDNADIFLGSIYKIPFENKFDIVLSIGVLQHLQEPKLAADSLVKAAKKGGVVVAWVYGYEGNEFIVKYINPLRSVTSRAPIWVAYVLAYLFSIALFLYLKIAKPKTEYFKLMARYSSTLLFNIVFDQLIPKIANYWTKEQALALWRNRDLKKVDIYSVAGNTWTIVATKK